VLIEEVVVETALGLGRKAKYNAEAETTAATRTTMTILVSEIPGLAVITPQTHWS